MRDNKFPIRHAWVVANEVDVGSHFQASLNHEIWTLPWHHDVCPREAEATNEHVDALAEQRFANWLDSFVLPGARREFVCTMRNGR